ncbi:MAG: biopolymer transporter ExbD [Parvularculales bacterium]
MKKPVLRLAENPPRRPYEAVTPLINIVFLLLIFFLLAGTIRPTEPVDVTLPESAHDDGAVSDSINIYLEEDGFVWLEGQIMPPELVALTLPRVIEEKGTDLITVKPDKQAPAHALLSLLEALREVDIEEIVLTTESPS